MYLVLIFSLFYTLKNFKNNHYTTNIYKTNNPFQFNLTHFDDKNHKNQLKQNF
ncbi:hypothetical protein CCO0254 [Campylobacter coli RM2228]|nr:hypothetical protein CCO0254 [Campylobacter coli RM2228]